MLYYYDIVRMDFETGKTGCQQLQLKEICKQDLILFNINPFTWKITVQYHPQWQQPICSGLLIYETTLAHHREAKITKRKCKQQEGITTTLRLGTSVAMLAHHTLGFAATWGTAWHENLTQAWKNLWFLQSAIMPMTINLVVTTSEWRLTGQVMVIDRNSVRRKILVSIAEWMKFCSNTCQVC